MTLNHDFIFICTNYWKARLTSYSRNPMDSNLFHGDDPVATFASDIIPIRNATFIVERSSYNRDIVRWRSSGEQLAASSESEGRGGRVSRKITVRRADITRVFDTVSK